MSHRIFFLFTSSYSLICAVCCGENIYDVTKIILISLTVLFLLAFRDKSFLVDYSILSLVMLHFNLGMHGVNNTMMMTAWMSTHIPILLAFIIICFMVIDKIVF